MARHRKSLRMGMDDDLAQRLPWGGRCLDCGALLTETPQLTEESSLRGRSNFLKFVCIHKEDAEGTSLSRRSSFLNSVRVHKEDAEETSLSRRSFFLKFVRLHREDADDS